MQLGELIRIQMLQPAVQHVAEKMVVAIPAPFGIQRNEKQFIRSRDSSIAWLSNGDGPATSNDGVTQNGAHMRSRIEVCSKKVLTSRVDS